MMKIDKLILTILALAVALIGPTIGNSYYMIHAENAGAQTGSTTFSASGTVTSRVGPFILVGPMFLGVTDGKVSLFIANITTVHTDATSLHKHEFTKFHQTSGQIAKLNGNNSVNITGTMDVGLNKKLNEWDQVPTKISVINGTTVSIVLNDANKSYPAPREGGPSTTALVHFSDGPQYNSTTGSKPITGLIRQFTRTETETITH
jgi:hypothetical protein